MSATTEVTFALFALLRSIITFLPSPKHWAVGRSSQPLIADMWIQSGHQHQTITEMLSDALFIGFDPNGAAIAKTNERRPSGARSMSARYAA
jgi:hypothetical protein